MKTWFKGTSKLGSPIGWHKKNIVSFAISPENISDRTITINLIHGITHLLKFEAGLDRDLFQMMQNDNER